MISGGPSRLKLHYTFQMKQKIYEFLITDFFLSNIYVSLKLLNWHINCYFKLPGRT